MDTEMPASMISLPKSDPQVAAMFSDCKPGDEIVLSIGYGDKTVKVNATVGEDSEDTFSAQISGVADADPDADADGAGADPDADADAGAAPTTPAAYIKQQRK